MLISVYFCDIFNRTTSTHFCINFNTEIVNAICDTSVQNFQHNYYDIFITYFRYYGTWLFGTFFGDIFNTLFDIFPTKFLISF